MPKPQLAGMIFILPLLFLFCSPSDQSSIVTSEEQASELVQPAGWWNSLPRPVYASLEKVSTSQEWYEVYKLCPDTWALYEPFQFEEAISYLVAGTEKAVLIDTGTGIGDLKRTARELTGLPVMVVNTHTHWDHIGDNAQFTQIACHSHPECIAKLRNGVDPDKLRQAVSGDSVWKGLPPDFSLETWSIPPVEPTILLEDGDIIELGGRSLEVIYTPGHSPGSLCLLDKDFRLLFTGDTFFPGPLYAHPEDVDIQAYMDSIDILQDRLSEFDILCSGHNDPWVKSDVIPRVAAAFNDIMTGRGRFQQNRNLRRYTFQGFDILIRTDQIPEGNR
jgi:glyoxylase-like metal-dependent hydrolase (beta-lactamase superfamily II)